MDARSRGTGALGWVRCCAFTFFAAMAAAHALVSPSPAAERYVIVVHPSNPVTTITRAQASAMFLRKAAEWPHGGRVLPVDLSAVGSLRESFSRDVHGKDSAAIMSYWKQVIASGRGTPPPVKATDAEVVAYVGAHPGGIGYVSATAATAGAKVIPVE